MKIDWTKTRAAALPASTEATRIPIIIITPAPDSASMVASKVTATRSPGMLSPTWARTPFRRNSITCNSKWVENTRAHALQCGLLILTPRATTSARWKSVSGLIGPSEMPLEGDDGSSESRHGHGWTRAKEKSPTTEHLRNLQRNEGQVPKTNKLNAPVTSNTSLSARTGMKMCPPYIRAVVRRKLEVLNPIVNAKDVEFNFRLLDSGFNTVNKRRTRARRLDVL